MLAFEIYYLSGRSYSKNFLRGKDHPFTEWPPHPARFFSALVAAFKECELGEAEREALEWLEKQDDPQINVSDGQERRGVVSYVPANDPDWKKKAAELVDSANSFIPSGRKRLPRHFPSYCPASPFVYFIWPFADPNKHAPALSTIAERVTYLGSSASLVQVRLCKSAPPPTLVPDKNGEESLRVVRPGRLEYLENAWESGNRPDQCSWARYRRVTEELPDNTPIETVFGKPYVFHLKSQSGQSLSIQRSLAVTDAVHKRLLELAGDSPPDLLAEAVQQTKCAYVALPHVGRQYADGHIIGFAVILPKEINSDDRRAVLRVLGKFIDDPQLVIPGRGAWSAEHIVGIAPRYTLKLWTWTRPAREWRSVTPMFFDEFPDDRYAGRTFGEIVRRYCDQIGLPSPREVTISPYPSVTGAAPVFEYIKQRQKQERWRYPSHVTLIFDREVRGPVLLGAGRYFGMGLMRPMVERQEEQDEL